MSIHAISSGRVIPSGDKIWACSRFGTEATRILRRRETCVETVIGRFFSVERNWLLNTVTRTDFLANDAYLAALALREGRTIHYVDDAVVRYIAVDNFRDFSLQRNRADTGYEELRLSGVLTRGLETAVFYYVSAILAAAIKDPVGAVSWLLCQLRHKFFPIPALHSGIKGTWEPLLSTKRSIKGKISNVN